MTDFILILGMHRSGTSCLTGCLKGYGLQLGDVSDFNKYNQKGNQEKKEIYRLNEAILQYNNGSWNQPPHSSELKIVASFETRRNEIINGFGSLPKPWGIKDPRMLITYPFWKDKLLEHQFIGTFRHPTAVANSLAARKNLPVPIQEGFQLWKYYNLQLLAYHKQHGFPVLDFDLPTESYLNKVRKAAGLMGLNVDNTCDFFDSGLKHQKIDDSLKPPKDCSEIYDQLKKIAF